MAGGGGEDTDRLRSQGIDVPGGGTHRPSHLTRQQQLVLDDAPADSGTPSGRRITAGLCLSRTDLEALRIEEVGGAKLQTGRTRAGLLRLSRAFRSRHSSPLAAGVLRLLFLLVGACGERGRRRPSCGRGLMLLEDDTSSMCNAYLTNHRL